MGSYSVSNTAAGYGFTVTLPTSTAGTVLMNGTISNSTTAQNTFLAAASPGAFTSSVAAGATATLFPFIIEGIFTNTATGTFDLSAFGTTATRTITVGAGTYILIEKIN